MKIATLDIMLAIVNSNTTRKDFCLADILKRKPKVVGIHRLVMKAGLVLQLKEEDCNA